MLDFNHRPKIHEQIGALIDAALASDRDGQAPRTYLGASRLGVACERALQYEYLRTPVDPGREIPGRILRVFEVGHALEVVAEQPGEHRPRRPDRAEGQVGDAGRVRGDLGQRRRRAA